MSRAQQTPQEIYLKSAGSCPDNRGNLSYRNETPQPGFRSASGLLKMLQKKIHDRSELNNLLQFSLVTPSMPQQRKEQQVLFNVKVVFFYHLPHVACPCNLSIASRARKSFITYNLRLMWTAQKYRPDHVSRICVNLAFYRSQVFYTQNACR
jgi:hypothetical protein